MPKCVGVLLASCPEDRIPIPTATQGSQPIIINMDDERRRRIFREMEPCMADAQKKVKSEVKVTLERSGCLFTHGRMLQENLKRSKKGSLTFKDVEEKTGIFAK